ncbi:MAG: APC family permease [Dehalococcoidia bacterium]|nr:MAG: APC family permease [Dehalococcoidia bacterium]
MSPDTNNGSSSSNGKKEDIGKLNPDLISIETHRGARPGESYARVKRVSRFIKAGPGYFVAKPEKEIPQNSLERGFRNLKRFFIGRPLYTAEEGQQRLNKIRALAVFGSDAISSSAYATEASLAILMVAGSAALGVSMYTALAVAILLSIVAFSYRQTVHAYPQGGGSYNVSSENLGQRSGLIAAAALLIDYVLTVSVSIVAGSQGVISALIASGHETQVNNLTASLPPYLNLTVMLSIFFIGLMILGNLRGVREAGTVFSIPTYLFIVGMCIMIVMGVIKASTGTLHASTAPPVLVSTAPLTLWLVLRAFSAGAVAMSGTEAISNAVPAFKTPSSRNAATTLTIMATLLGIFFLGITFLSTHMQLVPGKETIISQVALAVFGHNIFYYVFQFATVGILVVAANTAFNGFPRLASVLARDNFMPHQFKFRGDRLVFSTGILFLGIVAAALVVVFEGNVDRLINLYAIGVFLAFCLSNLGMVVHWWRSRTPGWKRSMVINATGAILTAIVLVIAILTKFTSGGWLIVVLIPIIVSLLMLVHRHYTLVGKELSILPDQLPPTKIEQLVLVLIDDVNYASLRAFSFARTIDAEKVVLHIATDPERTQKLKDKMQKYAPDLKLVIIESPTRSFIQPLSDYIAAIHSQSPTAFITLVLPEFITAHFGERFLHNRTAARLREIFEKHPNVTLVMVPYLLEK